jgi:hypothetical protein
MIPIALASSDSRPFQIASPSITTALSSQRIA